MRRIAKIEKPIAVLSLCGMTALTTGLFCFRGERAKRSASALAQTAVERTIETVDDHTETGDAEQQSAEPYVIDGAFVRWKNSDGKYGLKFSAYVGEKSVSGAVAATDGQVATAVQSGKSYSYSMKILPRELMTLYENSGKQSESLGEFCERIATQFGGVLAAFDDLTPQDDGTLDCAIVDLQWHNLNRSFFALLCVTDENGETREFLCENEGGRYRSIAEVAQNALDKNALQDEERTAVEKLIEQATKEKNGVAIDADENVAFISGLSDVFVKQKTWSVADGGDGSAHDGWMFAVENGGKAILNTQLITERTGKDDGMCEFCVYAPKNAALSFVNENGAVVFEANLQGKRAKKLRLSSEKMRAVNGVVFRFFEGVDAEISVGGVVSCFMSEIVEKSGAESANELKNAIAELPDAATMAAADEEQFSARKEAVVSANEWQNALPETLKLSENSAELLKLNSLLAIISTSESGDSTSDEGVQKRIEAAFGKNVFATADEAITLSFELNNDTTYEKVVCVAKAASEFVSTKTKMSIDTSVCKSEAKDAKKIVFYVYAELGGALEDGTTFSCALSKNKHKNGNNSTELETFQAEFELKNGQWTEIALSAEQFFAVGYFTLLFDLNQAKNSHVFISPFFACY